MVPSASRLCMQKALTSKMGNVSFIKKDNAAVNNYTKTLIIGRSGGNRTPNRGFGDLSYTI